MAFRFNELHIQLELDMVDLYKNLPKALLSTVEVKRLITTPDYLRHVIYYLQENAFTDEFKSVRYIFDWFHNVLSSNCLKALRLLPTTFLKDRYIRKLCLQKAKIILCTASGAAAMRAETTGAIEILVVDEATQLKECESVAALQLKGLHNVVLIGDELSYRQWCVEEFERMRNSHYKKTGYE